MKKSFGIFVLDAVLVTVFVLIGTRNHDTNTGVGGVFSVAAPFLVGLIVGWLATRAWNQPTAVKTGVLVWIATVVVGVLLRRFAWDDSAAGAFVVVATIFNAFTLVGWRVVRENLGKRKAASEAPA
jgi:hypothetical protein